MSAHAVDVLAVLDELIDLHVDYRAGTKGFEKASDLYSDARAAVAELMEAARDVLRNAEEPTGLTDEVIRDNAKFRAAMALCDERWNARIARLRAAAANATGGQP